MVSFIAVRMPSTRALFVKSGRVVIIIVMKADDDGEIAIKCCCCDFFYWRCFSEGGVMHSGVHLGRS